MTHDTHWDALRRHAIGLEHLHAFAAAANGSNYPPHNIEQLSEHVFRLTIAVAGFSQENLKISLQNGLMTVSGKIPTEASSNTSHFVYRGLSLRDFTREFKLGDNVQVKSASLVNGILTIDLERFVPETQRPKLIAISV